MDTKGREKGKRRAAAARIAFVVLCVLTAEWVFPPFLGRHPWTFNIPIVVILAFGFLSHRALEERPSELGLRLDNFFQAARLLAILMILVIIGLVLIGYRIGSLGIPRIHPDRRDFYRILWLLWWGLLQQYALHAIVNRQAQTIWGRGVRSLVAVALIFASLHLPNLPLVLVTLVGGYVWAYVYQRAPNIFALALSHCLMTLVLIWTLPPSVLHGLRVGAGYR